MNRVMFSIMCCVLVLSICAPFAFAAEIDLLVKKLVDKGVLTPGEAQQLITETKEEAKKEIAQAKSASSPEWAQRIKLKGDARLRYEYARRKGSNFAGGKHYTKNMGRLRLRLGTEAKVNDQVKVYAGLASGSDAKANSTNQTFTDNFAKKQIWIDYAYAEYQPFVWGALLGGRMKNPIWEPGDMLWDTDINPEGAALRLNKTIYSNLDGFVNAGWFIVDYQDAGSTSWMAFAQPGFVTKLADTISLKGACNLYYFHDVQGMTPDYSNGGNNQFNGGSTGLRGYQWNFNSLSPAGEITILDPFKPLNVNLLNKYIPYLAIVGEWHHNLNAPYSRNGYLAGLRFGQEKVDGRGKWQAKYNYVLLESQAWPDMFPDSDRYGGRTGVRSNEFILSYGLGKNWSLDLDYYLSGLTSKTVADSQAEKLDHVFQADLNFKF